MADDQGGQSTAPANGQQAAAGAAPAKNDNGTNEDFERKLSDLAAENKKYRQNYAKYKEELEQTQATLREVQEKQLQEQGKFKDLYEKTAKDLNDEKSKRLNDRAQWTGHVVASRFAAEAVKAGCQDVVALVKIANSDGLLGRDGLVSDENFEVNSDALKAIVEETKKANPILFAKGTPAVRDGVPNSNQNTKLAKTDLSGMKMEDLISMAKTMN